MEQTNKPERVTGPAYCRRCGGGPCTVTVTTGLCIGCAAADGDVDPGFGFDPGDSARLLELRQAIDAIGWNSQADEERGDYLGRLKEIREELGAQDTARGQVIRQQQKLVRQRKELRRLNAAERERSLAVSLAHHQHAVYVDPQAERRRIAHLVWSVAQLLEKHPAHFTDRSVAELRDSLSAWDQRLVAP